LTEEALEQATSHEVAEHHAHWLDAHAGPGDLLDLGTGIGGDLLALAARRRVVAYELDPVRARFAQANAEALGLGEQVEVRTRDWVADLHAGLLPPAAGAFADPARRVDERRVFRLDQMQPPIAALLALQAQMPLLGVKVMPGLDLADLPQGCGVEFVGHAGACKEAVLWFGPARWRPRWAALVSAEGAELFEGDQDPPPLGELAGGQVLYEPHGALIRAGCLTTLCRGLSAHLFDPQIAYLVGQEKRPTPDPRLTLDSKSTPSLGLPANACVRQSQGRFPPANLPITSTSNQPPVQAFAVEEVHPFALKLLNRRLAALGVARVELKKRGFPVEPESLRPRLKLQPSGRDAVVLFSRIGDRRIMIIGRRLEGGV
jgi:hypothetical protein